MTNKALKYIGVAAIVYFVGTQAAKKITNNIEYSFTGVKLINFWENIKRFKVELEIGLNISNLNDLLITKACINLQKTCSYFTTYRVPNYTISKR